MTLNRSINTDGLRVAPAARAFRKSPVTFTLRSSKEGKPMTKAVQLSKRLEQLDMTEGMKIIGKSSEEALYFEVIEDAMCIMDDDGSVNIIEPLGHGVITSEVTSSENVLKVLHHFLPFKEVFKRNVQ